MAGQGVNERVRKHRTNLRAAGLRPVQIWVPDTRSADFVREADRQARRVAEADASDASSPALLDAALRDLDGWAG